MTDTNDLLALTRALISEVSQTDIIGIEWQYGDFRLKIERQASESPDLPTMAGRPATPAAKVMVKDTPTVAPSEARFKVLAPMHGIYYSAPEQSAPAFVRMGDRVVEGQVLCVIEAMKVFTSIAAEQSGTIVSIGSSNGQEVAPGDLLFEIATDAER